MPEEPKDTQTLKTVASSIGMAVATLGVIYITIKIFDILMLFYLSVVVAMFFSIFVDFVHSKLKVPRVLGMLIALLVVLGIVGAIVALVMPTFLSQGKQLLESLPKYLRDLEQNTRALAAKYSILEPLFGPGSPLEPTNLLEKGLAGIDTILQKGMGLFFSGIGGLITVIVVIIISIYIVVKPREHLEGILLLFPKSRRNQFRDLAWRITSTIKQWMLGQAFSMVIIAIMTMIGYWIAGIKFGFFFGILTGILCFVPYLGPVLSVIGPLLVSLIDNPIKVVWVLVIYTITQTVESYFLTPMIMKRQVDLPPVVTILAVVGMGSLMGVIGIALAVPTVAIVMVVLKETYLKKMENS